MVGSVFWWLYSCRFYETVRDGGFWVLCVSVLVCLCGCVCVYQRKKKYELVLQMEKSEKKGSEMRN